MVCHAVVWLRPLSQLLSNATSIQKYSSLFRSRSRAHRVAEKQWDPARRRMWNAFLRAYSRYGSRLSKVIDCSALASRSLSPARTARAVAKEVARPRSCALRRRSPATNVVSFIWLVRRPEAIAAGPPLPNSHLGDGIGGEAATFQPMTRQAQQRHAILGAARIRRSDAAGM